MWEYEFEISIYAEIKYLSDLILNDDEIMRYSELFISNLEKKKFNYQFLMRKNIELWEIIWFLKISNEIKHTAT